MAVFFLEKFIDGEMLCDERVHTSQRLLNEQDLDVITHNHDKRMVFVRRATDTANGYYLDDDSLWEYGKREDALMTIKRRL